MPNYPYKLGEIILKFSPLISVTTSAFVWRLNNNNVIIIIYNSMASCILLKQEKLERCLYPRREEG